MPERKIDQFLEKLSGDGDYLRVDPEDTWDIDRNQPARLYLTIDGSWTIEQFEQAIKEVYIDGRPSLQE